MQPMVKIYSSSKICQAYAKIYFYVFHMEFCKILSDNSSLKDPKKPYLKSYLWPRD
jgi:hypothetical protein